MPIYFVVLAGKYPEQGPPMLWDIVEVHETTLEEVYRKYPVDYNKYAEMGLNVQTLYIKREPDNPFKEFKERMVK